MMNEPLSTIMTQKLITLTPHATLGEVRDIFVNKRIHHIPIQENGKLVGLITSWDVFKLGKSLEEYKDTLVAEVMTTKLAVLEPSSKVGTAAEVLLAHLFHAIPIVDSERNLVGIVTTSDILKYAFKKEYPADRQRITELPVASL